MKKSIFSIIILIALIMLGCSSKGTSSSNNQDLNKNMVINESASGSISDYYPLNKDVRYVYTGEGLEYTSSNLYVDFLKENKIQYRVINGGTTAGQVFEIKNGELRMLNSVEEFYYRDDLTSDQGQMVDILLKEPLVKGTTWLSASGKKKYIASTDAQVKVPFGSFSTIEVITENGDNKIYDYYARGVGLVKRIFNYKNSKVTVCLEDIIKNVKVEQTVKFYYPEYNKNLIVFKKIKINMKTNDQVKDYFQKYFKEKPAADASAVLSKKTKINKLYLNRKENKVYIDFSKEIISDLNSGSGYEAMMLQSIANTLGDYYNVDKIQVTVSGKNYKSGHIVVDPQNPLIINLKETVEIK